MKDFTVAHFDVELDKWMKPPVRGTVELKTCPFCGLPVQRYHDNRIKEVEHHPGGCSAWVIGRIYGYTNEDNLPVSFFQDQDGDYWEFHAVQDFEDIEVYLRPTTRAVLWRNVKTTTGITRARLNDLLEVSRVLGD